MSPDVGEDVGADVAADAEEGAAPAVLSRDVLTRAALRGVAVSLVSLVVMLVAGAMAGMAVSSYDLAFVLLLGSVAAPTALVEAYARPGPTRRHLTGAALAALLVSVGFVAAWAQMTYLESLLRLGSFASAHENILHALNRLSAMSSETRAVLGAYAPPFALVLWLRVRGFSLKAQLGLGLAAAQLISLAALTGFQGFPQVRWLVGAPWCSPAVGTFLFLQPLVLPLALPLIDAALDGRAARRQARREERLAAGLW